MLRRERAGAGARRPRRRHGLKTERRASELGAELLGFYHSHPDHPARPSQYDLDHAFPTFSYIIVSVRGGTPEDMTSWRLRDDRSAFDPKTSRSAAEELDMPNTIHIPTPLRPFTDKQESVQVSGAHRRRAAGRPDEEARRAAQAPLHGRGQAAELRQRVSERRRHPLPAARGDAGQAGRQLEHRSVGGRRSAEAPTMDRARSPVTTRTTCRSSRRTRSSATAGI